MALNFVLSILKEHIYGTMRTTTICGNCENASFSDAEFHCLEIPVHIDIVKDNKTTLEECLQSFFRVEQQDESEIYNCMQCQHKVAPKRKIDVVVWPKTLIIQLKRFLFHYVDGRSAL